MKGRHLLKTIRLRPPDPDMLRLVLLALFFAVGAMLGHSYASACVLQDGQALGQYLRDYCSIWESEGVSMSLASCVVLYGGYAAAAFLLGFASVGVLLIPALSGAFGFFTMYTVSCFTQVFGREGVALAMAVLLVRLLFSLPCFFAVAASAWPLSTELALLAFGRGKRSAPVLYGSRYFLLFVLCVVILAVGVCCERLITPLLLRLALEAVP